MSEVGYTCVGSGTCVPSASRGSACHLLQAGDLRVLLDLGSGSLRSLVRLGESIADLDAVGLTHRHMDHVGDLLPLLFALRYSPGSPRTAPLRLFGYRGLRSDLSRLAEVFGDWVRSPGFELIAHELAPGERFELTAGEATARVTAFEVNHTPEAVSFGIEISFEGSERGSSRHGAGENASRRTRESSSRRFAYSGDSGATEALVELAAGADLFVCECAFPDAHGVEGHLTPSELLPLCASARPRRTVATHFYPVWDQEGMDRLWREAYDRYGGEVSITPAHDGLHVRL